MSEALNMPKHIGIIMDGNGRWAKARGLPRNFGHRKGAFTLGDIAKECNRLGVNYLTVFAFSTENWKRPAKEVEYLMNAPVRYIRRFKKKITDSNIRIKFIGRKDRFPENLLACIADIEQATSHNTGTQLNIAADYGGHDEIVHACREITKMALEKEILIDDVTKELVESRLYTAGMDNLDLLIRTSGEERISNFMLWQLAYAEIYFTETYWPAFDKHELEKAINSYQSRQRRFGGLKETKT